MKRLFFIIIFFLSFCATNAQCREAAYASDLRKSEDLRNITRDIPLGQYAWYILYETGEFTQARLGNQLLKYDPIIKRVIVGHAKNKEILSFYKALPQYVKIDPWTDAVNIAIGKTGLTIKDLKFL